MVPLDRRRRSDALDIMERDGRLDESALLPEFNAIIVANGSMHSLSTKTAAAFLLLSAAAEATAARRKPQRCGAAGQIVRATQK
jgi:hypothetical protein